ncbi:MAG: (d)CMP kinase [Polyangiaceae bacterium]|nr:(d)CMP kinase [Polyangiaceae bacterium]
MKLPVVAIDGPAGAGKTTVSQRVADALGYTLVDTGALYRSVALAAKEANVDWDDAEGVGRVAERLAREHSIRFGSSAPGQRRIYLGERDVSEAIRAADISQGASRVSALPSVRAALLEMQRSAGEGGGVVLEGRDIGTVVFPSAEAKFFLTANVEVRARRRHEELRAKGTAAELAEVAREVAERDKRDSSRPIAPLRQADDATVVDSSELGIDEVVRLIVSRVEEVAKALNPPA